MTKKTDEFGWERTGKGGEKDPDLQFLKLRAKQARPVRWTLYALLAVAVLILYTLMNPVEQHITMPTVDFNPSGKQAAWKTTDLWLQSGYPLGTNPAIVSWDGSTPRTFKGDAGSSGVQKAADHSFTVRTDSGWWTVDTVVKTPGGEVIGAPSAKRRGGLPKTANGDTNVEWAGTLSSLDIPDALTRACTQWGQALAGSNSDLLTALVKDPNPEAVYPTLRLGGAQSVETGKAAYLKRGKVNKDANTSDMAVVRVYITLKGREGESATSRLAYDVLVSDPDGQPRILAWGAPGDGPDLKEYSNSR